MAQVYEFQKPARPWQIDIFFRNIDFLSQGIIGFSYDGVPRSARSFRDVIARLDLVNSIAPGQKVPAVLYLSSDDERQDVSVTRESKKERYQFKARVRYYPSGAQGPPQQDSGQEPSQFKATPRYRARLFLLC